MTRSRKGFTIAEISIYAGLAIVALSILVVLQRDARRSAARTESAVDAMRSAVLATEALRADLRRMVYQQPADVRIGAGGRRVTLLCAAPLTEDLWRYHADPVSFELVAGSTPGTFQLVRRGGGRADRVPGVTLASFSVRRIAGGSADPRVYLEVVVVGAAADSPADVFTSTFTVPLVPERPFDS